MRTPGKIVLGIVTLLSLASTIYVYYSFLTGKISLYWDPKSAEMPSQLAMFAANGAVIFGLMITYILIIVLNRTLSSLQKVIWGVLIIILNILIMPIFFFIHVAPVKTATA